MLRIIRAAEPSDVIWENAGYTTFDKTVRRATAFVLVIIVLGIFFAVIYGLYHLQVCMVYMIEMHRILPSTRPPSRASQQF
jgi:archaellum biogenesis protein FlaJ (TadC family)